MIWRAGDDLKTLRDCVWCGGMLGLPTESSYALGVDPQNATAVERVFAAKGRAATEPLGVVVANVEQAAALGVDVDSAAFQAALALWPAALNVLVEVHEPLPAMSGASLLSLRIPDHGQLRELLLGVGRGLTATSANRSGETPVLDPRELDGFLAGGYVSGEVAPLGMWRVGDEVSSGPGPHEGSQEIPGYVVVDGGRLPGGAPSTMVIWKDGSFRVLRQGRTNVSSSP